MDNKCMDKIFGSFYNKVVSSRNLHSQGKVYLRAPMTTLKRKLSKAKHSTCFKARFKA